MVIKIDVAFEIGQVVYLVTDPEQMERIVYGITITKSGLLYKLACGTGTSDHYDFEISEQIDLGLRTRN